MPVTTDSRLEYLFKRYFEESNTQEEEDELLTLVRQAKYDDQLKYLMDQVWGRVSSAYRLNDEQSERILSDAALSFSRKRSMAPVVSRRIIRWSAAAVVLLVLFATAWMWRERLPAKRTEANNTAITLPGNDVAPGSSKARLILGNGSSVLLDSVRNGVVARQGNMRIVKLNGQLSYNRQGAQQGITVYNTIVTPRGGQYRVILPDGSQVWLNAVSSLRFPTAFTGTERRVQLTGEAYFEIAENKDMPFQVSVNGMEVKVLGTHFDIMAYNDEPAIKTTLLQGSVEVLQGNERVILKPGQQACLSQSGDYNIKVNMADVQAVTAWKDGLFFFRNTPINTVLQQIARWYGTEVINDGNVSAHLNGMISRNTNLSQVLHMLEVTSDIKFKIEGSKVFVMTADGGQ